MLVNKLYCTSWPGNKLLIGPQSPVPESYAKIWRLRILCGLGKFLIADSAAISGFAMNSLEESCTPLKAEYDSCFNSWFRDVFLKGNTTEKSHDEVCGSLFKEYQACLTVRTESICSVFRSCVCFCLGSFGETQHFERRSSEGCFRNWEREKNLIRIIRE